MKKFVITILIILVALTIFLIIKSNRVSYDSNNPQEVPEEAMGGASGQFMKLSSNAVVVMTQLPGDNVVVSAASLENGGFMVVKKDQGGNPGEIIGVSEFLTARGYDKFDIGTTESLVDGLRYYVQIYKDDGNGIFDPKDDSLVYSDFGPKEPIRAEFEVDKDAEDPSKMQINF